MRLGRSGAHSLNASFQGLSMLSRSWSVLLLRPQNPMFTAVWGGIGRWNSSTAGSDAEVLVSDWEMPEGISWLETRLLIGVFCCCWDLLWGLVRACAKGCGKHLLVRRGMGYREITTTNRWLFLTATTTWWLLKKSWSGLPPRFRWWRRRRRKAAKQTNLMNYPLWHSYQHKQDPPNPFLP